MKILQLPFPFDPDEKLPGERQQRRWGLLKRQAEWRSWGSCERCYSAPMALLHHLHYRTKGYETLEDVRGVCQECHDYIHGRSDYDPADVPPPWVDDDKAA